MQTVIGLIPQGEHVVHTQQKLAGAGISRDDVSVVDHPGAVWQRLNGGRHLRTLNRYGLFGAIAGLVITAVFGLLATGVLTPGYMAAHATMAITILVISVLIGLGSGYVFGATLGLGDVDEYVYSYMEGVRRGDALLIVPASHEQQDQVADILRSEEGKVIQRYQP